MPTRIEIEFMKISVGALTGTHSAIFGRIS